MLPSMKESGAGVRISRITLIMEQKRGGRATDDRCMHA
jgi:hypothetical protein